MAIAAKQSRDKLDDLPTVPAHAPAKFTSKASDGTVVATATRRQLKQMHGEGQTIISPAVWGKLARIKTDIKPASIVFFMLTDNLDSKGRVLISIQEMIAESKMSAPSIYRGIKALKAEGILLWMHDADGARVLCVPHEYVVAL